MDTFKYKSSFASPLVKIANHELDKYISLAGLESLKELMPDEINLKNNPDLIGASLNAAVLGRVNLNGDSVSNGVGVKLAKSFLYKFVDSNHNRNRIVGSIVNTGFSEFGTNKLITPDKAIKSEDPINISLAIVLYKIVLPEAYIKLIEDSADPTSANYGTLSASWELLFADYDIAVGNKNVVEAQIYSSEEDKKKLEPYLKANGGSGEKDGKNVYRVIKGDFLIGTGIGLVQHPAAAVKGLVLASSDSTETFDVKSKNNISQLENQNVNSLDQTISKQRMKISNIKDITDESLKQAVATAADIRDFIESELKQKSEEWVKEKTEKDRLIKEANDKYNSLAEESKKNQKTLESIQVELQKLQNEKETKDKQEKFNQRMASIDETYELDNEDREVISKAIVTLATDEAFVEYEKSLAKLLRHKNKAWKAAEAKKAAEAAEAAKKNTQTTTAAANNDTTVNDALDNAKKDKVQITNAAEPDKQSLKEKYSKYFDEDSFEVSYGRKK